jgi:uncharacterized protein YciI
MNVWAVFFRPGPAWDSQISFREQPGVTHHSDYLRREFDAGRLLMGGPFTDDAGGLSIFTGVTEEELRAQFESDESIRVGLLVPEIHPWYVPLHRLQRAPE